MCTFTSSEALLFSFQDVRKSAINLTSGFWSTVYGEGLVPINPHPWGYTCTSQTLYSADIHILSMIWKKKDLYTMLKCFDGLPSPVFCLSVCLSLCPHYLELHVLVVTWPTSCITHFPPCRPCSPLYHSRYAMIKHMTCAIAPTLFVSCPHCQNLLTHSLT